MSSMEKRYVQHADDLCAILLNHQYGFYIYRILSLLLEIAFSVQYLQDFQPVWSNIPSFAVLCLPRHHHYKVAYALCPSAIDVCNGGNILQEKGCEVCQHQSCFKLNSNVPAE